MLHIKEFFKKFSGIAPPEKIVKDAVIQAILKEVGEKIEPKDITVRSNGVLLSISGPLKTEIFMRKEEILRCLKEVLGPKAPRDIR